MPEIKIIILTIYDIDEYRDAAINSGAFVFILKKSMRDNLIQSIRDAFKSQDVSRVHEINAKAQRRKLTL